MSEVQVSLRQKLHLDSPPFSLPTFSFSFISPSLLFMLLPFLSFPPPSLLFTLPFLSLPPSFLRSPSFLFLPPFYAPLPFFPSPLPPFYAPLPFSPSLLFTLPFLSLPPPFLLSFSAALPSSLLPLLLLLTVPSFLPNSCSSVKQTKSSSINN